MNKKISAVSQEVIKENINGLDVYFIPFKGNSYSIRYVVRFGSDITEFKRDNDKDFIKIPKGVAHFLEHKMFEEEDGVDPFSFYSKYGTDANASTGHKKTEYTLDGVTGIEKNLDFLLKYVNEPYFTDQNVESEKDIIIQEILMYMDEPDSRLLNELYMALFKKHNVRYDIAGSVASVRKIKKEDLYNCYNTFYNKHNMYLIVCGNFDKEKIINVIKNNKYLDNNSKKVNVLVRKPKEGLEVFKKEKRIYLESIYTPRFLGAIKMRFDSMDKEDMCKFSLTVLVIMTSLFGDESKFKEDILARGLVTTFSFFDTVVDEFLLFSFYAEGECLDDVIRLMKRKANTSLTKDMVERAKRSILSDTIFKYDTVMGVCDIVSSFIDDFGDIVYDEIDIIKSITLDDVNKVKENIDFENSSFVIAEAKK